MVEIDACHSCLTAVRVLRVALVDELEGRIETLLEGLVSRGVFTRDDREQVLCHPGPRARVRKVLDILECKGEEAARVFFSVKGHPEHFKDRDTVQNQHKGTHCSKTFDLFLYSGKSLVLHNEITYLFIQICLYFIILKKMFS